MLTFLFAGAIGIASRSRTTVGAAVGSLADFPKQVEEKKTNTSRPSERKYEVYSPRIKKLLQWKNRGIFISPTLEHIYNFAHSQFTDYIIAKVTTVFYTSHAVSVTPKVK